MSDDDSASDPTVDPRDLSAFQRNILVVLAEGSEYGLGIKQELEAYYGSNVNHGRLYPNLDKLVDAGYIEKSARDRRTNEYALTDKGLDAICDHLRWMLTKATQQDGCADRIEEVCADITEMTA